MKTTYLIGVLLAIGTSTVCAADVFSKLENSLRTEGFPKFSGSIVRGEILWPRLVPDLQTKKLSNLMFDVLIEYAKTTPASESRLKLFEGLAMAFISADGWTNRVLADTATRLALDDVLVLVCLQEEKGDFIETHRLKLPVPLLDLTLPLEGLLSKEPDEVKVQFSPGTTPEMSLLQELGFADPSALWVAEALRPISARELLMNVNRTSFVARLAQLDVILQCHLPLLANYFSKGGEIADITNDGFNRYTDIITPEPKYSSRWMGNQPISFEHLIVLMAPYQSKGRKNGIRRELLDSK